MANAEQIFNDCTLDLVIPNGVLPLPPQEGTAFAADDWCRQARQVGERHQAFFDEKLEFFLTITFRQATSTGSLSPDAFVPPPLLLSFLNHLQLSLDASYIPPTPTEAPPNIRLTTPPARSSSSLQTPKPRGLGVPLPIFPPQTPSPKPSTSDADKKYAYSEGTPLKTFIWGENSPEEGDSFRFLRSSSEKCWIAIYRMSLPVVYIRTELENPLLCLTISITLRDKPLAPSPQKQTLLDLIEATGQLPPLADEVPVEDVEAPLIIEPGSPTRIERGFLEEINLLEGLSCDECAESGGNAKLYLPTTRLGLSARQAYSLPPLTPISSTDPKPKPSRSLPVLRKSFRKVLSLASGFHVRMRTILIPQLLLPQDDEHREVASNESTVVLSIEIENPGDSEAAFSVETVEVYLKNEAIRIRMIGWGEEGFKDPAKAFPLFIHPAEQYYLLYAVTFLRSPEIEPSLAADQEEFKKTVSFNIIGRPFTVPSSDYTSVGASNEKVYLTSPFLSRWNCRLDLDPRRRESLPPPDTTSDDGPNAIPVPPSPFPITSPRTRQAQEQAAGQVNTVIGAKRHTFAGTTSSPHLLTPQRPTSLNTSPSGTPETSRISSPFGKLGTKSWTIRTPLSTLGGTSPPLPPLPNGCMDQKNLSPPPTTTAPNFPYLNAPQTPAFPTYGNQPLTPRPNSVTPSLGQMGSAGMEIDARREKAGSSGMPMSPAPPMTPRPQLGIDERALPASLSMAGNVTHVAKDFVVSVSIMPPSGSEEHPRQRLIHPLDEFLLEIFVFNQSPYVRRLEATLADRYRRREDQRRDSRMVSSSEMDMWKPAPPAFLALESKVQIGPLGPSTCQSVTMRFLAMLPGIHTIDGLVLTDSDMGGSVSLRSVMDFAVLPRDLDP